LGASIEKLDLMTFKNLKIRAESGGSIEKLELMTR
jgi:hypothetical protein